jgi:hypothetical protein
VSGSLMVSDGSRIFQRDTTIFLFTTGLTERECPVHANRAFRCATIQSIVPSSCTTAKEVTGDLGDNRAVKGLVEDT